MKVLCVGQVAYDITLVCDQYPIENRKMRIKDRVECAGGSAFNSACLLNKWGVDVKFVGAIGSDYYSEKIIEEIKSIKLKSQLKKIDGKTTTSYIISNISNGNRTILTDKNFNLNFNDYDPYDEMYDYLVLDSSEYELSNKLLDKYPNAISILDAGKVTEEVKKLGKKVSYFVCSEDFARDYTNNSLNSIDDIINAYEIIKKDFPGKIVITLGDRGSFTENNGYKLIPTIKVETLDSTGAGDIYHGAFTYFILKNFDIEKTMKLSNVAGAISTTKIGSINSYPNYDEVIGYDI